MNKRNDQQEIKRDQEFSISRNLLLAVIYKWLFQKSTIHEFLGPTKGNIYMGMQNKIKMSGLGWFASGTKITPSHKGCMEFP